MAPYLDIVELLGIELEDEKEIPEFDADDKYGEAAELERKFNLGEVPNMSNNYEWRKNLQEEENLEEQEIIELTKDMFENLRQEGIMEVDDKIENYEIEESEMENRTEDNADIEDEEYEIMSVAETNENDENKE